MSQERERAEEKDEKEKEMLDGWGCRDGDSDTQKQGKQVERCREREF